VTLQAMRRMSDLQGYSALRTVWTLRSVQQNLQLIIQADLDKFKQGYNARKVITECTHLLYCSVLSLSGNVNTRRMSKPDMGSIFHIKNQWNVLDIGNYYVNYQNLMLLTSSDTKRTLMYLFLFTNSAQRKLVSICTQSIRNCN